MSDIQQKAREIADRTPHKPSSDNYARIYQAARLGILEGLEMAAKALQDDAKLCDCSALEESECACGAWCEWKSITSARAVEIVRAALQETGR